MAVQSWIDDLVPVCGPLAGAARRYVDRHGISDSPPRGVEALRHLLSTLHVDTSRDDAEDAHRTHVESAGAFFGLVLADHLGHARHVEHDGAHGLRLGDHGFLDPFEDVADVLSADDPSDALIAAVARAEAEAADRSAPARVVRELARQLDGTGIQISGRFGMCVWLQDVASEGDIEVAIGPLVDASRGESRGTLERTVGKVVGTLTGRRTKAMPWSEAAQHVLPRLVGDAFLQRLEVGGAGGALQLSELAGELRVAYILDHGGRARFLRRDEVESWSLAPGAFERTALHNLAGRSSCARLLHVDHALGTLVVGRSGDGLDAARLLLPGLHPLLSAELGEQVVVAVPHRDLLLACDGRDATALSDLHGRALQESRRAPHAISSELYLLGPGGQIETLTE